MLLLTQQLNRLTTLFTINLTNLLNLSLICLSVKLYPNALSIIVGIIITLSIYKHDDDSQALNIMISLIHLPVIQI